MHGIQTYQHSRWFPQITANNDSSQTQLAQLRQDSNDTPITLTAHLNSAYFDGDNQVFLKRNYSTQYLTNNSQFDIICETWWLRARRDTVLSLNAIIAEDAPPGNLPYISPTTGDNFRKIFKIIKSKTRVMRPARVYKTRTGSGLLNKKITKDVDGDTTYTYRKGNIILFQRFYGVPVTFIDSTNPTIPNTCLGPMIVRGVFHDYVSYYTMDTTQPNTSATTEIPQTIGALANNNALLPTYVNVAYPNTATSSTDFVYPNTVDTL